MITIPEILNNPNNPSFQLEEMEIYNLKETMDLMQMGKDSFALFALWSCVLTNLQRRVEFFGIKNYLSLIKEPSLYNETANSLKERWLNINEFELIEDCKKLNIINSFTSSLIKSLYWMKNVSNENKKFSKDEIFSIMFLLEKNLFLEPLKKDQREKSEDYSSEFKRRREDKEEVISTGSTTHEELLLKNGVKHFENNLDTNNKNDKLLTAYI